MRIGIDGRVLSNTLTGIGRYTEEVLMKLNMASNTRLFLYAPSPIGGHFSLNDKLPVIRVGACSNRMTNMLWSQSQLPFWAAKDEIDLFWGTTHRLPHFLQKSIAKVVTIHDLVWKYAPHTMRPLSLLVEKRLMPKAIALADLVIADSQSTALGITEVFPQFAHKVRVVHLGVSKLLDPDQLVFKQLNIFKPYLLFVGTIEPRKNLERLLLAFSMLPRSLRDQFSLVIVGDKGWGGINLQKLICEYGLGDSVKILGYVDDCQLASLYLNARFLAMPSLYEGFGLPLLEAMQYGIPVLTSNVGSMAEVSKDGSVLVDPYSVESICAGVQRMLVDDDLINVLGKKALRRAQDFSWEKCAAETMAVFEEAIALRDIRLSRS